MSYTFAIGDIHGCFNQLERMLARIDAYASSGTVVFLGDYIDRGPASKSVLARLMAGPCHGWKWVCLKGNHEDMMVGAVRGVSEVMWWIGNGGADTLESFSDNVPVEVINWCADLSAIYQDKHRIFVHAGVKETIPLELQGNSEFLWLRVPPHYSGHYWGKHLVHGHTPSETNPTTVGNRTNLDSGCVFGGRLSCAVFDDDAPGGPIDFIEVTA